MSVVALTVPLELADGGVAYTGSLSGLGVLFAVKTTGYNSISVQLSGTWVATVTFQISNDGINWTSVATATSSGTTIYPTTGIYFQAVVTAYTSGTVNALAFLRFQQVSDITVDADLTQINANTAATATNTGTTATNTGTIATNTTQANVYLSQIAADLNESSVPITGSLSANGTLITTETLGANSISVQLTGNWEASVTFQASNDNTNWVNVQGFGFNSTVNSIDTVVNNDILVFPVLGRYFRAVVSGYQGGPVVATAYLRSQDVSALGISALSQAMDNTTGTPLNVTFEGVQGSGQQPAANSVPVTLSNENIQDKFITGRAFTQTTTFLNYNMLLDAKDSGINPGAPLDCTQYRSFYFQYNAGATSGAGSTVNATFIPEASNDLVNWTNVSMYRLDGGSSVGVNEIRNINPINIAGNAVYGGNIMMRFFRLRCSAFTSASFIQFTTILRMTPMTYTAQTYTNIGQVGGTAVVGGATLTNPAAAGATFPPIIVGGTDRSIVRSELIGAMGQGGINNNYLYNGPYGRNAYYDLAGAAGVAGPQPFLSEDKTYPVNVRLERSTSGQDSVQDLLQQILLELKINNHYTRETPLALATSNFSSMNDDIMALANDKTLYN